MHNPNLLRILFFLFIISCVQPQQQTVAQISQCIANCIFCDPKKPSLCLDQSFKSSGDKLCLPFYKGTNCDQQTFGYENILNQNGTFTGWSQNNTATCQLVSKNDNGVLVSLQNMNYNGLGSFRSDQTLNKTMQFENGTITNRAVIKFSVAVDDPNLQSYFLQQSQPSPITQQTTSTTTTNSTTTDSSGDPNITTQTKTQTLPNGTVLTYTISYYKPINLTSTETTTTTTNSDQSSSDISSQVSKKWMIVELIDTSKNQTISNRSLSFNAVSSVRTTCGFIYTYQISFDLNKQYFQLSLRFSADQNLTLTWTLLNFEFALGCRGFLASSNDPLSYNCDSCLSGYYPKYSINNQVQECQACDYRCKSCINATTCLTCIENTVLNQTTGMCQFSQFFKTLGRYQIIIGKSFDVGSLFGSQVVKSEGGKIQLSQPLENSQPFSVSFLLLYSEEFRNSGQQLDIFINDQKYKLNTTHLPLDTSTKINNLSTLSSNIYQTRLSYNVSSVSPRSPTLDSNMNSNMNYIDLPMLAASNQNASIKLQTSANPDQFGMTAIKVVQFQCSKNCDQCQYSQFTQTSQCTKCAYFFDLSTNCLTCANGYYPATINSIDQCIKCHSTCKQCSGPQITDCVGCFDSFQLGGMIYDYQCITCIYKSQFYNASSIFQCIRSPQCLINHSPSKVMTNKNCQLCLKSGEEQLTTSNFCISCWLSQSLAKSTCEPMPERGFQIYGSDISQGIISSQWTSNKQLVRKNLTSQYKDLYGVQWQQSGNQTTILTFTQPLLPSHRGLTVFFTLFKVNTWDNGNNDKINIVIKSQDIYIVLNNTINVNPSHGYNIYGDQTSGPQMMYTFVGNSQQHSYTGKVQIIVTSTHSGIFLRDMQVYLGNCNQCDGNKMTYQVYYIPAYSTNDTQTGLDVWLTFNQGVNFFTNDEDTQNKIVNSFQFSIDQLGYQNLIPYVIKENKLSDWNYVKYFLPIQETLINATLRVNNTMGNNIYSKISKIQAFLTNPLVSSQRKNLNIQKIQSQGAVLDSNINSHTPRLLLNQRLSSSNVQERIYRYENLIIDSRRSMSQLEIFYDFFQWFTLITMIIFAFFGIGIVFQEFSILLQLLFLHIYVTTQILPATFKQPLSRMQKLQNLNFFSYPNAKSIQQSWFSNIQQPSAYPFTQYNIDVYFARSFYPIIIINLIYLFWFIVLLLCYKFVRSFKTSPNIIIKFFRDIPQRPVNYLDQIWRYQFITTMWASFIQFYNFEGESGEMRLNLALCVISFIISIIWPLFVMIYTYRQHMVINVEHFMYLYNDIFYRKISSLAQKTSYYMYIAIRFGRYFFYALFIAVFIYRSMIGPVILLAITFLEMIYILKFKVYRDKLYLLQKLIENIGFILLEILLLIVYGFAEDTITEQGFVNIGYGINALYVVMIINGLIRVFYICFKKVSEILSGRYDYGEKGDLQNYDNKSPVIVELPTSERGLY